MSQHFLIFSRFFLIFALPGIAVGFAFAAWKGLKGAIQSFGFGLMGMLLLSAIFAISGRAAVTMLWYFSLPSWLGLAAGSLLAILVRAALGRGL